MGSLEALFLLVAYIISPFSVGWGSRSAGGTLKGFLTGLALVLIILWGFFLANYFGFYLLGLHGPVLTFFSAIISLLLLLPGWRLFRWGESLAAVEGGLRQGVYQQIKGEIARPFNQMSRKLGEIESTMEKMAGSINRRHAEVSSSLGRMDQGYSNSLTYLKNFQAILEKIHGEILRNFKELKDFLKTVKPNTDDPVRLPAPPEKPAFTRRGLTTEDGRKARLGGREWQKWVADYIRKLVAGIVNIVIETNFEKGKPDFVLRDPRTKKPIATGACKSYNLYPYQPGKHRSSQRTVDKLKGMSAESKFSERHKIPLFLAVVNQRTSVVWFRIIPHEELDSFERVTTPSWLAQDNPSQEEIERNHREFVEFLKSLV